MSANDEILIIKEKDMWKIYHRDVDERDKGYFIGEGKSLEEAVETANAYEQKQIDEVGIAVEYGIRIKNK